MYSSGMQAGSGLPPEFAAAALLIYVGAYQVGLESVCG